MYSNGDGLVRTDGREPCEFQRNERREPCFLWFHGPGHQRELLTTQAGGASGFGTVFELTSANQLSALYSFCWLTNCADDELPEGGLVRGTSGNFYGTTQEGGANLQGTVFTITAAGKLTTLYSFTGGTDGGLNGTATPPTTKSATKLTVKVPDGATTGPVTVTTSAGTLTSNQTFKVKPQITSFMPTSGAAGMLVTITGTSLEATNVTFGGVKASFSLIRDTEVTATVPTGAKTGHIVITATGGSASSNGVFTVP